MIDYNYPDIFMGEAVQKNLLITDGTVTVSGDTYTVTGDTVTITNSELETEAFELHQSINSDMQLRFGSCESAYISFVFRKTNITTLIGKTLKVYIIPNHEASKILQLGVFKVQTDKLSYDGTQRQITAYDAMYDIINSDVTDWYNTQFPNATTTKSLGLLIESFLDHFGLTAENLQSLVNKTRTIRRTIDPEQLSGADVIRAMCEINGVFGMITNEGNFRFKKLLANMRSESAAALVHEIPIAEYMDIHFDDYDAKRIDAAKIISDKGSDSYAFAPNPVNIYVISGNFLISDYTSNELHRVLMPLRNTLYNNYYTACTVNALGNPVLEPGDSIKVITKQGETYTYVLERHMRGVQALRDTYTAHGEEYSSESLNSISSRFSRISSEVSRAESSGSITADANFVEIIRNIGFRLLDEPTVTLAEYDEANVQVSLKWTDPSDIATDEPVPATWAGTVVVRKEGSAPLHRWDGTLIVNSTTRDAYSSSALADNTVELDKQYFYGIFPYDTKGDYRYTKVVVVSTEVTTVTDFDYTGSIQTFTVPKDGIYQLEVWGAQGGTATDDDLSANGGYGSYSTGEVELHQGDTLYIVVGGQGGYNGGGSGSN